jgi:PIN domain nuclease of toxin-antitoxin system
MRVLLDTHVLLRAVADSRKLPKATKKFLEDPENEVWYSTASLWEIAIKNSLGKPSFRVDAEIVHAVLGETGFLELPIRGSHAVAVAKLPNVHRDPFDRMLAAQALTEPLVLLTNDKALAKYPIQVRIV